jgi:hypothetical protein
LPPLPGISKLAPMAGRTSPGRKLPTISFGNSAYNRLLYEGREGLDAYGLTPTGEDRAQLELKQRDSISRIDGFGDV